MNKVIRNMMLLLIVIIASTNVKAQTYTYGSNLILNPDFEAGPSLSFNMGGCSNWSPGHTLTTYIPNPGGSPDLFDYGITYTCFLYNLPNILNDISNNPTYPLSGDRYIHIVGGYDPPTGTRTVEEGESILGELTLTCPGTYEVWLNARVPLSEGCAPSMNPLTIDPNCKIEVRLFNSSTSAFKLIYTTPQLTQASWVKYSDLISITSSDITAGYDRIELRMNNVGGYGGNSPEERSAFIDDVGLRQAIPKTITSTTSLCGYNTDLTLIATTSCLQNELWVDINDDPLVSTTVSPEQNTTYKKYCTDVNGCIQSIEEINVTVNNSNLPDENVGIICAGSATLNAPMGHASYSWSPGNETSQSIIVSSAGTYTVTVTTAGGCTITKNFIVARTDLNPINVTLPLCGEYLYAPTSCYPNYTISDWSWVINGNPPVSPADPNGRMPLSPGDNAVVTITYTNGCSCVININVVQGNPDIISFNSDPDGLPSLICDDELFSPLSPCPIALDPDVIIEWYKGSTFICSGFALNPTYSDQDPETYTRIIKNPFTCEYCVEEFIVQAGAHDNSWPPTGASGTEFDYIPVTALDPSPPISGVYRNCDGCIEFTLPSQHNTINDFADNCHWVRRYTDEGEVSVSADFNAPLAAIDPSYLSAYPDAGKGFSYDPVTNTVKICMQYIYAYPGPNEFNPILQEFCYICSNDDGTCEAERFCLTFDYGGPCKRSINSIAVNGVQVYSATVDIYPNPTTGIFTLQLTGYDLDKTTYTVTDATGREIKSITNVTSEKSTVDLSEFDKGIYFIRIKQDDVLITKEVIIQ